MRTSALTMICRQLVKLRGQLSIYEADPGETFQRDTNKVTHSRAYRTKSGKQIYYS